MTALFLFFVIMEAIGIVDVVAFKVLYDHTIYYKHFEILGIGVVAMILAALSAVVLFGWEAMAIELFVLLGMCIAITVSDAFV